MAKFTFNKNYKDLELKRGVKAGEEVEMTIKRADEVVKTVKEKAKKEARFKAYKDFEYTRLDEPGNKDDDSKDKKDAKDKE